MRPAVAADRWAPVDTLRISFSTSRIKWRPPPAGEKTTVSLGHANIPKQHVLSGFPADRGHSQKGVDGTVVTMHTPSVGLLMSPRCGRHVTTEHGVCIDTRRIDTILSNGTSISMLPIQNRNPPSAVMSTVRTTLYQNQATNNRFNTDTATTVACAPIGTAATKSNTKIISNNIKRSLNAVRAHQEKNEVSFGRKHTVQCVEFPMLFLTPRERRGLK